MQVTRGYAYRVSCLDPETRAQPGLDRGIPEWPPTFSLMPELVFAATDDHGGQYTPGAAPLHGSWSSGGRHQPFGEGEFNPRFSPCLSPAAQLLRLEVAALRWVRTERRTNETQVTAVQRLGWMFEVPLASGRLHIAREEPPAAESS